MNETASPPVVRRLIHHLLPVATLLSLLLAAMPAEASYNEQRRCYGAADTFACFGWNGTRNPSPCVGTSGDGQAEIYIEAQRWPASYRIGAVNGCDRQEPSPDRFLTWVWVYWSACYDPVWSPQGCAYGDNWWYGYSRGFGHTESCTIDANNPMPWGTSPVRTRQACPMPPPVVLHLVTEALYTLDDYSPVP